MAPSRRFSNFLLEPQKMGPLGAAVADSGVPKNQKNFFFDFRFFFYWYMRHNDFIDRKNHFWPRFHIFHASFTRFTEECICTISRKSCKIGVKYMKSWSERSFSIDNIIMPHVLVEKKSKIEKKNFFDFLRSRGQRPQPVGGPFFGVQEGNSKIASMTPFIYTWCTPS